MDYKMEIALLDLDNEVLEKKPVKQKKSNYVPIPRDQWKRGKHSRSLESRKKQSETMKARWHGPERERLIKAISHKSPEQRQRLSEAMKERFKDPEYYNRQVEHLRSIRHRTLTPEEKQRISDRQRGDFWITNGTEQHKVHAGTEIPSGWWRGRLPFSEDAKKNMGEASRKFWSTHTMVVVPKDNQSE